MKRPAIENNLAEAHSRDWNSYLKCPPFFCDVANCPQLVEPTEPMSSPSAGDSSERRYNSRLGLILFFVYLTLYLGFVLINAFKAEWMDVTAIAGLNLAIVYGFALIVFALVLALIYGAMCRTEPIEQNSDKKTDETNEAGDSQ